MRRKTRDLTVHKFGGASLADAKAMRNAVALAAGRDGAVAVVVSALARVTDALLEAAAAVGKDAGRIEEIAAELARRHRAAILAVVPAGSARQELHKAADRAFEELALLSRAPVFVRDLSAGAQDALLSRGEEMSARIFAAGLSAAGRPAVFVEPTRLIATDGRFGGASPRLAETDRNIRRVVMPILKKGVVPVVAGFYGAAPDGRVVTLGRGGSDLTATLLARALSARAVYLWKDVPGILTADPRLVPDARVVPQLNIREAAELAYYGARVLQPRALIPVGRRSIPVFVRPFEHPNLPGTEVSRRSTLKRYPVKALSAISGQALLTVTGNGMLGVPGIAARTFAALHRDGISVSLISQASSEHSICLSVPQASAKEARRSLLEAFAEEIARREIDGVELLAGLSTISVVGLGMAGTPGIAARVFSALAAGGINVVAIAQGSSELNISFVVSDSQAPEAQRRIHEAFQLSKIGGGAAKAKQPADVVLLGFGQVGRTLAGLVRASRGRLRLCAVIDRSGFSFRPGGLSAADVKDLAAAKKRGLSVARTRRGKKASASDAIASLAEHALSRPILVDVTAESTTPLLVKAASSGFDLVLANKRPLSGPREEARSLERTVGEKGRRLRFEATVGAGLPILDTHRKLVESGDRVLKIEGCLSGTLGFLLSEIERGATFSASLRQAIANGYTEPDPRDDLSGADVGRKALILGRLLGFAGEPADVEVESLVPNRASALLLKRFLESLSEFDREWRERADRARARGKTLRYVASVTRRKIRVGLDEVGPGSPFYGLKGTDNQVAFTTVRYRTNPLVVQGPGAGLAVTAGGIFNDVAELAGQWNGTAVRAFAPGTVANLGPGSDILGLAVEGAGDTVRIERAAGPGIVIRDSGHPDIPREAERNTAGIAAARVLEMAGKSATGLVIDVVKGLPLSGGQGGSAASAAAAAVAVNALLGSPLPKADLLGACLAAEEAVAGRHADNVAAALFGGVILVRSLDPLEVTSLSFPDDLLVVLVAPDQRLRTEEARAALPASVERGLALAQAAQVGAIVAALASRNYSLLSRSVVDRIAEPVRAPLLPGFSEAKAAALEAGALGCSISGSGPAAFAFASGKDSASRIGEAMIAAYERRGVTARARACRIDARGARVLEQKL